MVKTNMRYIRVDEELWRKAMTRAHAEGVTLSKLIRDWLDDYANDELSVDDELQRVIKRLATVHKRLKIGDD